MVKFCLVMWWTDPDEKLIIYEFFLIIWFAIKGRFLFLAILQLVLMVPTHHSLKAGHTEKKKKKKKGWPFATTWMDFEDVTLREINQPDKDKYCMISLLIF